LEQDAEEEDSESWHYGHCGRGGKRGGWGGSVSLRRNRVDRRRAGGRQRNGCGPVKGWSAGHGGGPRGGCWER
jgi:hypothetical protein